MNKATALPILGSLASPVRLDVYRLLVRAGPEGLVAGEIASALEMAPNTLSFHLKDMTRAGLLGSEQEGRFQRYRANLPAMLDLVAFLTEECCGGQPELCDGLPAAAALRQARQSKPAA